MERRDNIINLFNQTLGDVNVREVSVDTPLDFLCNEIWSSLVDNVRCIAVIERHVADIIIEQLLGWAEQVSDSYNLRRNFNYSFGNSRTDRDGLTFVELKRVILVVYQRKKLLMIM